MTITTILFISFWFTIGCVATLAGLDLTRKLLLIGLTALERRLKAIQRKRRQEEWMTNNRKPMGKEHNK